MLSTSFDTLPEAMWKAGCDSHAHIFGSEPEYPFQKTRQYTPPQAPLKNYEEILQGIGLERAVIVQPSVYGSDNRCTADAVKAMGPDRARGVAVIDESTSDQEIQELHETGFRGARFNLVQAGGVSLDQVEALTKRIAPYEWHLQVYLPGSLLETALPTLLKAPLPIVVDHMGQMPAEPGLEQKAFQDLLRALDSGRIWVKLSAPYRVDPTGSPDYPRAEVFARKLIEANPDRLVWGSDWPHPNIEGPRPDVGRLFSLLQAWTGKQNSLLEKILVHNPARLYGF